MRRRDFAMGLLLAAGAGAVRAQERAKQRRIAIVVSTSPVASINDTGIHAWRAFFAELRGLGDVEGQNLTVARYSGEGRPAGFADLAREVVSRNPDLIVAIGHPFTLAISAATCTIPIVASGTDTSSGVVPSLARPGGNITGVRVEDSEIYGKRLQILKEAVPSALKIAYLDIRTFSESTSGPQAREQLRKASEMLEILLADIMVKESTSSEYRRVFAEFAQHPPDAILVGSTSEFFPYRRLIVDLAETSGLPGIYAWRDYVEVEG
jgi:putative ABC transport system substrate-binding protein